MSMIKGIDVSRHNGTPDFAKAKASGVSFVYVKATEGKTYRDPLYQTNAYNAMKAGIPVGFYHFARPDNGNKPEDEAANFVAAISPFKYNLIPVLDLERLVDMSGDALYNWAKAFIDAVKAKTGHNVMLYTGFFYLTQKYPELKKLAAYNVPLWLAAYRSTAPTVSGWDWTVWQCTETGTVPGVGTADVDIDYCTDLNKILIGGSQVQYYEDNALPLSVGSKGDLVKKLQARLGIKADGLFGPGTKQAVMNWQKAHGFPVTGIVDQKMWDALFPPPPPMHHVVVDGKAVIDSAYKDKVLAVISAALDKYQGEIRITKQ